MALPKTYRVSRLAEADLDAIYGYTVKTGLLRKRIPITL